MIYICYKTGSNRYNGAELVHSFPDEREAVKWLKDIPKSKVIGVFKGERLDLVVGETRVVKKAITGFGVFEEETE